MAIPSQLSIEMASRPQPGRSRWEGLVAKLEDLLAAGYPSGLALAVVEREGATFRAWGGFACVVGEVVPLQRGTLFDLASLTKVLASAPLALLFSERGEWSFEDPVGKWVPGFPLAEVTLMHLLTHTSGLVAHRPFFAQMHGRAAFRRAVLAEASNAAPPG